VRPFTDDGARHRRNLRGAMSKTCVASSPAAALMMAITRCGVGTELFSNLIGNTSQAACAKMGPLKPRLTSSPADVVGVRVAQHQ
jgi:hypothetical protein